MYPFNLVPKAQNQDKYKAIKISIMKGNTLNMISGSVLLLAIKTDIKVNCNEKGKINITINICHDFILINMFIISP